MPESNQYEGWPDSLNPNQAIPKHFGGISLSKFLFYKMAQRMKRVTKRGRDDKEEEGGKAECEGRTHTLRKISYMKLMDKKSDFKRKIKEKKLFALRENDKKKLMFSYENGVQNAIVVHDLKSTGINFEKKENKGRYKIYNFSGEFMLFTPSKHEAYNRLHGDVDIEFEVVDLEDEKTLKEEKTVDWFWWNLYGEKVDQGKIEPLTSFDVFAFDYKTYIEDNQKDFESDKEEEFYVHRLPVDLHLIIDLHKI